MLHTRLDAVVGISSCLILQLFFSLRISVTTSVIIASLGIAIVDPQLKLWRYIREKNERDLSSEFCVKRSSFAAFSASLS